MKVAMISYNTFVDGERNGWKKGKNSLLLLQNPSGNFKGTFRFGKTYKKSSEETKAIIFALWEQLKNEMPTIDKVVFYVGSYGAERVIRLAADHGLTPNRAVFVLCDCDRVKKIGVIHDCGFSSSETVWCECGGYETMSRLYRETLGDRTFLRLVLRAMSSAVSRVCRILHNKRA